MPAGRQNSPPEITAVSLKNPYVQRGEDIEVLPEGADPDGDLVFFRYFWHVNGQLIEDNDEPVLAGDRFKKGDKIFLRVVPSDGKMEGEAFTSKEITIPNAPPVFISEPPLRFGARTFEYCAQADDPDGDILSYSLETFPAGMTIDSQSGQITWRVGAAQSGEHRIRILAQDADGARVYQEFVLTIAFGEQAGQ